MQKSKTKFKEAKVGRIPKGWRSARVEDFAEVIGGSTPSTKNPNNFNGDIPWITPRDLSGYQDRYIKRGERNISKEGLISSGIKMLPSGTILLTSRAPVGYLAIASNNITTNQGFKSLIVSNKSSALFIYYLLKNNIKLLKEHATGSTFQELSGSNLKKINFDLPPIEEQKKIAEVLGTLDEKIELNRKMNKTLESLAQNIFKKWFIFTEDKKMPDNYTTSSLDQIADFLNGIALQKFPAQNESDSLPVIKIKELKTESTANSDKASSKIDSKYVVENGDILFSWSGSLDIVIWCGGDGALNQHLFKVTSKEYPKWFYYYWIKYYLEYFQMIAASKATTMGHIQRHHLTNAIVIIPDKKTMNIIDSAMSPIVDSIINNKIEITTISKIRDLLFPRLMSGKLRVG